MTQVQHKVVVRCYYCCKAVLATMPHYLEGGYRLDRHTVDGKMCEGRYDLNNPGKLLIRKSDLLLSERRLSNYLFLP